MTRVRVVCARYGITLDHLASRLGVSVNVFGRWSENGVPTDWCAPLAAALRVAADWIGSGAKPPRWFVSDALERELDDVDWQLVPEPDVFQAWLDRVHGEVLEWLLERAHRRGSRLVIPDHVRVQRWRFLGDFYGSFFVQFQPDEARELAEELGCWPGSPRGRIGRPKTRQIRRSGIEQLRTILTRGFTKKLEEFSKERPVERSTESASDDPRDWEHLLSDLARSTRLYGKAARDPKRRDLERERIRTLLERPMSQEPLLTGAALVHVLGACTRAAWSAEIIGPMRDRLEHVIESALFTHFIGREFTLQDLAAHLEEKCGLRLSARGVGRPSMQLRSKVRGDTVSPTTIRRRLDGIVRGGKIPLRIGEQGRTWLFDVLSQ